MGNSLSRYLTNTLKKLAVKGKNIPTISRPVPILTGKDRKRIFVSGAILAITASIIIINRKAPSIGPAILSPSISIVLPAIMTL